MSLAPRHRGIALLLVLATLVIAVPAAAALARVAAAARMQREAARSDLLGGDLLRSCEAPILDWLHRHSARVTLPPDAPSPRVRVLDQTLTLAGEPVHLAVTAFDQCGMASMSFPRGLPAEVSGLLQRAGEAFEQHPGLDALSLVSAEPVFPSVDSDGARAGERLATHGRGAVNVNTAPIPLLEAVYASRGLVGLEAVTEARAQGRLASPGARSPPNVVVPEHTPLPVSQSSAWAFRIDCRVGSTRRSWWCVYTDSGSNWTLEQRLAIAE